MTLTLKDYVADVVKGCAMLVNSNLFNEVGKFDEKYFLFYEEIDLCKKIKKKIICSFM